MKQNPWEKVAFFHCINVLLWCSEANFRLFQQWTGVISKGYWKLLKQLHDDQESVDFCVISEHSWLCKQSNMQVSKHSLLWVIKYQWKHITNILMQGLCWLYKYSKDTIYHTWVIFILCNQCISHNAISASLSCDKIRTVLLLAHPSPIPQTSIFWHT